MVDWRVGPSNQYYNGIANQSVFIQGFKIAVWSSILGTKWVKVKAQPPVVRPQQGASYYGFSRLNIGARLSSSWFGTSVANTSRETDADSEISIAEDSFDGDGTCDNDGNDITMHIPEVISKFQILCTLMYNVVRMSQCYGKVPPCAGHVTAATGCTAD